MKNFLKNRVRWNVLILVGLGYISVLIVFVVLTLNNNFTAQDAFNIVDGPLMALIGGSLAISKDLINDDDLNRGGSPNTNPNEEDQ